MPLLERTSKTASAVSILLILGLQLAVHPDMTLALRGSALLAFIVAALLGRRSDWVVAACLIAAPLSPALGLVLAGREGPVVDVPWMAGLAGALVSSMSWSRWSLPDGWRPLVGGWALLLVLAWPVLIGREVGFSLAGFRDSGAVTSWALLSAPQVVGSMLGITMAHLLGLLWLDWLGRRVLVADAPSAHTTTSWPVAADAFWIGATLASLVSIYQGTIDLAFMSTPFWADLKRSTGTMLNANAYGVYAAIAGPFAFAALRARGGSQATLLATAVVAINMAGMWMSGSRTALLCSFVGLGGLAIARITSWPAARRTVPVAVAASAIVIASLVFAAGAVGPLRRLREVPRSATGALTSLLSRGGYGTVAMRMIREHPLTGVGIGTFDFLAPDYSLDITGIRLPRDNAQNWWRHYAAELGLLGALPLFALSAAIAWRVVAGRARPGQLGIAIVSRSLLVAIGLCSMVGVPTQNPVVLMSFFLLVGCTIGTAMTPDIALVARHARAAWFVLCLLAVFYGGGHAVLARGALSVPARALRESREYVVGAYPPEPMEQGTNEYRWTGREAHFIWPVRSHWMVLRVWAHHPDIEKNPVRLTLSTPCGPFLDEQLSTPDSVSIGVEVPAGQTAVQATARVSRTWKPASYGERDDRELGIAIAVDFVENETLGRQQMRTAHLPACLL